MYCKQKHLEQKQMYCKGTGYCYQDFLLLEAWLMSRKFQGIAFSVLYHVSFWQCISDH